MRAGVVGANWGRVHVHALREHGVDVVALAGDPLDHARTRPAAEQLGIDLALQKPDALLDLELDLVTVATPAVTHPPLLALFAGIPTLCEKPLLGMTGDAALLPRHSPTVWLNYAFPFLDSARVFAKCVRETGTVTEVRIVSLHDLPGAMTGPEWFLEIASHPLSFAVHLFGPPRLDATAQHQADRTKTLLRAHLGDVPAQITCRAEPGLRGIEHRILVRTAGGNIALVGRYRTGEPWRFEPVRINDRAVNDGEWTATDCWVRANVRSIGTVVKAIRGGPLDRVSAHALFPMLRARAIDDCVRQAFQEPA